MAKHHETVTRFTPHADPMKTSPAKIPKAPAPALIKFDKERFDRNLAAAIAGLTAQFERLDADGCFVLYREGQDELDRSVEIARRAIQVASVVEKELSEDDELSSFDTKT